MPSTDAPAATASTTKNAIRLAVSMFYFGQGLGFASWASRIPTIKADLGLSEAQLGTILLMLPIGQLLTMPLSATLVNKYGSGRILPLAAMLYALVLVLIAFSSNAWMLGAALFLFGIFGNLSNISVNTQGVLAEDIYGRSIMSSFHGAWSLAGSQSTSYQRYASTHYRRIARYKYYHQQKELGDGRSKSNYDSEKT